jgi:hypothetical protein
MTILYLGVIIVLLQSYIRLACKYRNVVKAHRYACEKILDEISDIKNQCHKKH